MMSLLDDSHLDMQKIAERDVKFKVSITEKRKLRESITLKSAVDPGADHWVHRDDGLAYQTDMVLCPLKKKEISPVDSAARVQ